MEIKHKKDRFYMGEEDAPKAVLDYKYIADDIVSAYHTMTDPSLQGQGVAGKLFEAFIAMVQEKNLKVQADCSYVLKKMTGAEYEKYLV